MGESKQEATKVLPCKNDGNLPSVSSQIITKTDLDVNSVLRKGSALWENM